MEARSIFAALVSVAAIGLATCVDAEPARPAAKQEKLTEQQKLIKALSEYPGHPVGVGVVISVGEDGMSVSAVCRGESAAYGNLNNKEVVAAILAWTQKIQSKAEERNRLVGNVSSLIASLEKASVEAVKK